MNALEKTQRDREIIADRARGLTWDQVAEKHNIDGSTARRAWAAVRDSQKDEISGADPMDTVFDLIRSYEEWMAQLAKIAEDSANDSARIGAIRSQVDIAVKKTELLQATGLLPKQLGKLRVEMDIRYMTTQILALFDKYDVPVEAQKELATVLQRGADGQG